MPTPPADALLSAERMRTALSSPASGTALLQRPVRTSGAAMVAMEGPAELPGDRGRQRQTQRAEPALSRTSQKPSTSGTGRSSCGAREGNHQRFFSNAVAIAPAATKDSFSSAARPTSASVRAHAGAPWNGSGNASGAGAG